MRQIKGIWYQLGVIALGIILLNILAEHYYMRLDFTADKIYTLSESTKNILKSLKDPVKVTAYFSEGVPPELQNARNDFKDLLIEYASLSGKKVKFEFMDPSANEELEQKAQKEGIQPAMVDLRSKDKINQQKVYLGAVVHMGENTIAIPMLQPGAAMEYDLSSAIRKLSVKEKPVIGFLQGQGEPPVGAFQQVYNELNVMYQVEPVYISDSIYDLNKYKTLVIVAPRDPVSPSYLNQLDRFLKEGGNMLIALNRVEGQMQQGMGVLVNTGFEKWLMSKGIVVDENLVTDELCGVVGVQEQQMGFILSRNIEFHYFPILKTFTHHPVTEGLEAVIMSFVSTVSYKGDGSLYYLPLVSTSEKSAALSLPVHFDLNKEWNDSDYPSHNLVVAAAFEGKFGGNSNTRMIVFGDGDFAVNGEGEAAHEIPQDNASLFVNAVDWLSDDTGLIALRTKSVTLRPLEQLSDTTRLLVKILNFSLPVLIIIGYGLWRIHRNRKLRLKRMDEGYIW